MKEKTKEFMKEKTKEFMKKYLIGFVLGVITAISISVIAATYFPSKDVTYDNTASGLESTNVQGAIDELYGVCFPPKAGDQIIEDQPLEKDPYECRYFFTGANPNNYVTFNGENAGWRIISVGCDGTIKIMKTVDINTSDTLAGDSSRSNNWARPASLNTYLNGTYLNSLSSEAQGQIVASDYSIGPVTLNNNDLAGQVNAENSKTWNGKIALPTVSEYLRTNSNSNCKTFSTYNNNSNTCRNTTWMYYSSNYWWTLSPDSVTSYRVFVVRSTDIVNIYSAATMNLAVRPAITLSSEVQITGGDGTQNNPYVVS